MVTHGSGDMYRMMPDQKYLNASESVPWGPVDPS
jgi:hypothetical protein